MALRKRTKNPAFATNIETIVSIVKNNFCPVSQVAKCFVPFQIFWVSPKIWLHLVPLQKLLCWHKNQLYWMQMIVLSGTKCLWLAQYVNKFLFWPKKFGLAQNPGQRYISKLLFELRCLCGFRLSASVCVCLRLRTF